MSHAENLDSRIRASYIPNVKELSLLWERMGLSTEEIETRISTVVLKICDITTEMVECDRENKMKLEEACNNLKKDIRVMRRKLKKPAESDILADGLTLLEQQKMLKLNLLSLEKERNEIMGEFRSMIEEERTLAAKLGLDAVKIDEDTIPDKEDIKKVEDNLRSLSRIKEERETRMFTMKEHIVALMEKLGMDMNATMLSLALDGEEELDSLKLTDLRSIQHTVDELEKSLEEKKVEVQKLLEDINGMYIRLDIPQIEQCPFSTGRVCGDEELIKEGYLYQLKKEKSRLEKMKVANMRVIVGNAKSELYELWEACMVGEVEREAFLNNLNDDTEDMLAPIENEISRYKNYQRLHKDTFMKLSAFFDLCDLAQDLKDRMKDPSRLFKNRGKALMKEEQDRKKVNTIPTRKEELLALAEHKGNLIIYDEMMSTYVEDQALIYEELFPQVSSRVKTKQSSSLSSTKSGKTFSIPMPGNKTASPRSTKKLGRFYKSPVARSSSRTLRTPQSQHSTVRPSRMTESSPIARSSNRMTRSNTTLGMVKNKVEGKMKSRNLFNDGTINESAFTENVPYNSTVCMNSTTDNRSTLPVITMDTGIDNTVVLSGLIDELVAARDAAVLQDRTLRHQNTSHGTEKQVPIAQISKQDKSSNKSARKLRRSNSCSDLSLSSWKQGDQRKRLTSRTESKENLASIREYTGRGIPTLVRSTTTLTRAAVRGSKGETGKLSRAGSSSNLMLR